MRNVLVATLLLFAAGSLFASRLNPVSWSLTAVPQNVAPGSVILLRLHAEIEGGYHLYSFTTPGGRVKTKTALQSTADLTGFSVYQPKPKQHLDPNLHVPVETFEKSVDFLVPATLARAASTGEKQVTVSVRYQACSSELCLPPVTKTVPASFTVQRGTTPVKTRLPSVYQFAYRSSLLSDAPSAPAASR